MAHVISTSLYLTYSGLRYLLLIPLAVFLSCSGDSEAEQPDLPTNLSVTITITGATTSNPTGDGSGEVVIVARADNAVRYGFRIGNGELQQNSTGTLTYTAPQEGTNSYSLEVFAYSGSGESISKSESFQVFKEELAPYSTLVFADEFEYDGTPDPDKWHHQVIPIINGTDWANGEVQHYTARIENSYVSSGTLKIKAIKENYTYNNVTKSYTSARLNSKFAFKYGRVEVRAKLPAEAGTWPAIWTLGANIDEVGNYFDNQYGSVGWPACGEIDIMEQRGWDKTTTIGYFHWGDTFTGEYKNEGGDLAVPNTAEEYHVYTVEWDETSMHVMVDEVTVYELSNTADKPFDNEHYILLNIAMGGNLGGNIPGDFTESIMEIDYVRVYQ
ncbi:family 16 glycosylhydrolase [Muriicola sp.]|uniref:glycoside hydrolase family 16 protein n=1 Tax=Muriicola sp. TaxID=2020856 RepID=UPI003563DE01